MRMKRNIQTAGIFLLCLELLTGCARTERTKTVLLPEKENVQKTENIRTDDYQVKKIYTWEYAAPKPESASLLACGEHEMRVASVAEDGSGVLFDKLDYRYGFHETYGTADMYRLAIFDGQNIEYSRFIRNALSLDGRFLLWWDEEGTNIGPKVWLNNLETGEAVLLLEADDLKRPREEYFPLACWSRDGKYLAYCFFPKTEEAYETGGEFWITVFDLETKENVGQYLYNKREEGSMLHLEETQLYLDVADGEALAVMAIGSKGDEMLNLEICSFKIGSKPGEEQSVNYLSDTIEAEYGVNIYPDIRTNSIYVGRGFDWLFRIDATTGSYGEGALMEQYFENGDISDANMVNKFVVLDKGETVIGTEVAEIGENICIYRKKDERLYEKEILYHYNSGALTSLQYDEVNHRLLAVSSTSYRYGASQTAIILEF